MSTTSAKPAGLTAPADLDGTADPESSMPPARDSSPSPHTPGGSPPLSRQVGIGLILLALVLLGFAGYLYGFSGIEEARAQTTGYATLRSELAQQVAPLSATTPGAPVAILNIPAIGVKDVIVVEGTSPENLMLGPGHLRDTPLPGEAGVSEIFGRRASFGAPLGRLTQLRRGDHVTVITGQGRSSYTVIAAGDSRHLVKDPAPNRLLLVTACSALVPASYCYYDADLTSSPQADPGSRPAISVAEQPLSGDPGALVLTFLWSLALVIVSAGGTLASARWSPRLAYLAAAPLALAAVWNLYQSLAALLPNVY